MPLRQPAESALGQFEPDRHQGRAGSVDAGLGMRPLADPQRLLEQVVKQPSGRAGVLGGPQGDLDLAEDLRLADHHRVETAGDREQVLDGPVLVVHVQVRCQLIEPDRAVPRHELGDLRDAGVELLDVGVDLDPVTRRQHDGLGDVRRVNRVAKQLGPRVVVERDAFEQRHRCGAVRETDNEQAHRHTDPIGLALLVKGQDLQLQRQVDLADVHVVRNGQQNRCEVEHAADSGGDQAVAHFLRRARGRGDNTDHRARATDDVIQQLQWLDLEVRDPLALDARNRRRPDRRPGTRAS